MANLNTSWPTEGQPTYPERQALTELSLEEACRILSEIRENWIPFEEEWYTLDAGYELRFWADTTTGRYRAAIYPVIDGRTSNGTETELNVDHKYIANDFWSWTCTRCGKVLRRVKNEYPMEDRTICLKGVLNDFKSRQSSD